MTPNLLDHALRGASHEDRSPAVLPLQTVLIAGAGGALGSALLAEALVAGRFQRVQALVAGPIASAVRGFEPVPMAALADTARPLGASTAFLVFERERHSNGRDLAFVQPQADALVALATALHAAGVRRLLVVVPHAPALLPHALKAGFASEAERRVADLGFEHLVFLRAAQAAGGAGPGARLHRFAAWWLAQMSWMVPQRDQPVRAVRVAVLAVELARLLPAARPATRVLAPEVLWLAGQATDPAPVLAAWLAGEALPPGPAQRQALPARAP